jgi:RNA polymerase sigma-70 factor (sigma-E family)
MQTKGVSKERWQVASGLSTTFAEFFDAEAEPLRRFAVFLTGDIELANDLTQEALARVLRQWHRVSVGDPGAYARKTLLNLWRNMWRRRLVERRGGLFRTEAVDGHAGRVEEALRVAEALRILPMKQRAAVMLRYYEDRSIADVARILGRPEGTVKSDIHRALNRLRPLLEEET